LSKREENNYNPPTGMKAALHNPPVSTRLHSPLKKDKGSNIKEGFSKKEIKERKQKRFKLRWF